MWLPLVHRLFRGALKRAKRARAAEEGRRRSKPLSTAMASERGLFVSVTPARCEVLHVEPGVRHVLTLVVKNVSDRGRRIR